MSKNLQKLLDDQTSSNNRANSYIITPNQGKKFSEEHRAKIGASSKNRIPSAETRAKMSAARIGKKRGKPVTTPLGNFANTAEAAVAHGCGLSMMQWFLREKPELYFYTKEV